MEHAVWEKDAVSLKSKMLLTFTIDPRAIRTLLSQAQSREFRNYSAPLGWKLDCKLETREACHDNSRNVKQKSITFCER